MIPSYFWKRAVFSFALIAAVVLIGTFIVDALEGWSLLDSFYFTSFIPTGQGPPSNLQPSDAPGKVFSSVLAFVSVGTVITALIFLFGPFLVTIYKRERRRSRRPSKRLKKNLKGVGKTSQLNGLGT